MADLPPSSALARVSDITLDQVELIAQMFLVSFPAATRRGYQLHLATWLQWCRFHELDPLKAQRAHIELWLRELEEHGNRFAKRGPRKLMPATVAGMLNPIVGFYKFCHREQYMPDDITQYVKRPKVPNDSTRQGLTRFELRACLDAAKASSALDHALWCVLAFNGPRISEACAIDVEDLATTQGYRTVHLKRAKGNRAAAVPLHPVCSNAVDHYLGTRTTGPLFLKPRVEERLDGVAANRIVKRIAKTAGVDKVITNHSLRHTHITLALNEGMGIRDLVNSMGYADARQISRYDRDKNSLARSATWAVAGAIEGV